jgi:iron complex outermembrane receptor protein
MIENTYRKRLPAAVLLASGLVAGNAYAAQLEEVIVTAQKRTESLQDIPIAVAAFDADNIEQMRLITATDIGKASPYLQMPAYPFSNNNLALFIRGIGNADSIVLTKDPTVGVYYDGVYAARSTGLLADLAELERVEVLRGPQGTLYGRNTTAGAVNFISTRPSGELGFKQSLAFGDDDSWRAVSHLNLPRVAGFSAKLTAAFSDTPGWVDNEGPNEIPGLDYEDYYDQASDGYRIALRYDGLDNLLIDYIYDYSDMTTTPAYFQYAGPTDIPSVGFQPITNSFKSRLEATRTPTGGGKFAYYLPESETEVDGHNLTFSWNMGDHTTFKSITGYREFDDDASQNFAQSFGAAGTLEVHTVTDHEQFSQEFQLLGDYDRWNYIAGFYYFDEEGTQTERQYLDRGTVDQTGIIAIDLITGLPCSDGSTADPICTDFNAFFPLYLGEYSVDIDNESWAVFGQAAWTPNILNDRLDLTLGLRYTDDDREAVRTNDGLAWNSFGPGASPSELEETDYNVVADYRWTDDVSTYFKVSTGFRSGGSSRNGLDFNQAFDEETLTSYELGWKTELADQRVRFNGAIFHMEIDDIILDYLPDPVFNPQFVEAFNSGDADIDGLEIDLQWLLTDNVLLGVSYAYLDYEINDAIFPDGSDRTDSTELLWAPEHAYSVIFDWNIPTGYGVYTFHLDYAWQDDQFALANTDAGEVIVDDYGLLNARISLADVDMLGGNWQFAVFGENITDEDGASYRIGATAASFLTPRVWGAELIFEY